MGCYNCGKELIIGGDHTYEDHGIDDKDGLVTNLSCPNCPTSVFVYTDLEEEEDLSLLINILNEKEDK